MDRTRVDRAGRIVLLAAILVSLGAGAARAQEFTDTVSRQVALYLGPLGDVDAVGRQVALFNGPLGDVDAVGRQVALFTGPMGDVDANGRLLSVYHGLWRNPCNGHSYELVDVNIDWDDAVLAASARRIKECRDIWPPSRARRRTSS